MKFSSSPGDAVRLDLMSAGDHRLLLSRPPHGGCLFPFSAARSSVNRTLRVHGCSLAFGIG
jgi:hypothetical protein